MAGKLLFAPGNNILCFHGALIYEARVLKAEYWDGEGHDAVGPHYFVHYKGWKATWDEWVPEDRTMAINEENLKRQRDLVDVTKGGGEKPSKKKKKEEGKEKDGSEGKEPEEAPQVEGGGEKKKGGNKRKRDVPIDKEEEFLKKAEVKLSFPDILKVQLVDDWEWITKDQKLVHLPREPNVERILELYKEYRLAKKGPIKDLPRSEEVLEEVITGIKVYFEKALGNILLYRFERPQYQELIRSPTLKPMTQVYGAEHLLRLFVQFPSLIAHTNMEADQVTVLREYFTDFLKFLAKNKKEFFLTSYDNSSPAYVTSARG